MNIRRRIAALVACLAVALCMVPALARAAEPSQGTYLALGDSITSGYGLSDPDSQSFAALVADELSLELNDAYASDKGLTSSDLLVMFQYEDFQNTVSEASLISVTIGGNDVMNALYAYLADAWSTANPDKAMTADEVREVLETGDAATKNALIALAADVLPEFFTSDEAQTALESLSENLGEIVYAIKVFNPNAPLVIVNQYNPYAHLGATADLIPQIKEIVAAFDAGVQSLNAIIAEGSATGNYVVADSYAAFAAAAGNPCNASVSLAEVNLDFHPNAYGHELIAGAVIDALNPAASFDDVNSGEWYYESVNWAVMNGYLTGYADGTNRFGTNDSLTRAQFGEILYRAFAATSGVVVDPTVLGNYVDLEDGAWYSDSMSWAICSGLFKGYEDGSGRMGPDDPISREMVAEIFKRMAALNGADVSGRADLTAFTDEAQVSSWFYDSVSWAVNTGIIGGIQAEDGSYSLQPQVTCSRAQMATILMRWLTSDLA